MDEGDFGCTPTSPPPGDRARPELLGHNEAFQNPPVVAQVVGGSGRVTRWSVLAEDLPLTSLAMADGELVARLFNPTEQPHELREPRPGQSLRGSTSVRS